MAKDLSYGSVKIGSCGGCSTSYVLEQEQKGLGGTLAQGVRSSEPKGTAERCMALLLPRELSRRVFCQLDYRDLVQCSLVCKQWYLESTELRQGWKEELYWEARFVRGVHFAEDNAQPCLPLRVELHLASRPD